MRWQYLFQVVQDLLVFVRDKGLQEPVLQQHKLPEAGDLADELRALVEEGLAVPVGPLLYSQDLVDGFLLHLQSVRSSLKL